MDYYVEYMAKYGCFLYTISKNDYSTLSKYFFVNSKILHWKCRTGKQTCFKTEFIKTFLRHVLARSQDKRWVAIPKGIHLFFQFKPNLYRVWLVSNAI